MSYDDDWPDNTLENRRKVVSETIHPVSIGELRELGAKRFPIVTDPWYERFTGFLNKHPDARFFMASTPEGAEVIYCRDTGDGVWFLPGKGMGVIQPKGLKTLAEITAKL